MNGRAEQHGVSYILTRSNADELNGAMGADWAREGTT